MLCRPSGIPCPAISFAGNCLADLSSDRYELAKSSCTRPTFIFPAKSFNNSLGRLSFHLSPLHILLHTLIPRLSLDFSPSACHSRLCGFFLTASETTTDDGSLAGSFCVAGAPDRHTIPISLVLKKKGRTSVKCIAIVKFIRPNCS